MKKTIFITVILIILASTSAYGQVTTTNNRLEDNPNSGYQGMLNVTYALGFEDNSPNIVELHFVNGYRFGKYFFAGAGIGINYYYEGAETALVPFYADFRAYFANTKNTFTPYININIGYAFSIAHNRTGSTSYYFETEGLFFNPSIGISIGLPQGNALNISIGYQLQKINTTVMGSIDVNNFFTTEDSHHAIDISVGISF